MADINEETQPLGRDITVALRLEHQEKAVAAYPQIKQFRSAAFKPAPTEEQTRMAENLRSAYFDLAERICENSDASQHQSIALTELETSMKFALAGIYGF
jgi:hypothetical protein